MSTNISIRLFLSLAIVVGATVNATACPFRTHIPNPDKPEQYRQIFLANIINIERVKDLFEYSDLTPRFRLTVVEPITLRGEPFMEKTIEVGPGCGWPMPQVGMTAIFFVEENSGVILPEYDEKNSYRLKHLINNVLDAKAK